VPPDDGEIVPQTAVAPGQGPGKKLGAAGIVHAVGTVNFAFDKSLTPHIAVPDISDYFGVGKSSPAAWIAIPWFGISRLMASSWMLAPLLVKSKKSPLPKDSFLTYQMSGGKLAR
jgi:hypothetical protein